jgi:hypothetical protein
MERLKEMTLQGLLALCRYQMARGKERFRIYLKPTVVPPVKPLKEVKVKDEITGKELRLFVSPDQKSGGWIVKVQVSEGAPFNPVISGKVVPFKAA